VSASQLETITNCIKIQAQQRQTKTFQEEFLALLIRPGIQYDERYLKD
jgi:hypothetical protein